MATKAELEKRRAKKEKKLAKVPPAKVGVRARIRHRIRRLGKLIRRKKHRLAKRTVHEALVERYIAEAKRLSGLREPYVWGGSHGSSPTPANGPFDCSSYASHLDQTVLPNVPTMTTFSMASNATRHQGQMEPGEGSHITHFIKNSPSSDAHVITRIRYGGREIWTQAGGRDNTGRGGPCIFTPTASRIREFPIKVHPAGL